MPAVVALTVADVANELKDAASFLTARGAKANDEAAKQAFQTLSTNLMDSIGAKIRSMPAFGTADSLAIERELSASTLPLPMVAIVQAAVDNRLMAAHAPTPAVKTAPKAQAWLTPHCYLTADEWATVTGPDCEPAAFFAVVLGRGRRCGLTVGTEKTFGAVVALMLTVRKRYYQTQPKYRQIYQWVLEAKRCLDSLTFSPAVPFCGHLPRTPAELPAEVYDAAYDNTAPESRDLPNFAVTLDNHIPLRKSAKLLRDEEAREKLACDSGSPTSTPSSAAQTLMDALSVVATAMQFGRPPKDDVVEPVCLAERLRRSAAPTPQPPAVAVSPFPALEDAKPEEAQPAVAALGGAQAFRPPLSRVEAAAGAAASAAGTAPPKDIHNAKPIDQQVG